MKKLIILFAAVLTLNSVAFAQCGKGKKMVDKADKISSVPSVMTMKSMPVTAKPSKDNVTKMSSKPAAVSPAKTPAMAMKSKPATVNNGKTQVVKKDGTVKMKDGMTIKMKDGDMIYMNGKMGKM